MGTPSSTLSRLTQDAAQSLGWTKIPGPGGNPEEKKKKITHQSPNLGADLAGAWPASPDPAGKPAWKTLTTARERH